MRLGRQVQLARASACGLLVCRNVARVHACVAEEGGGADTVTCVRVGACSLPCEERQVRSFSVLGASMRIRLNCVMPSCVGEAARAHLFV